MKFPEILAPVGGEEQLIAAVRSGADAVYLGTKSFNARRNASNFEGFELLNAVKYAHARGVAVHVALNTLVFDDEITALIKEIETVVESGADAVIIQDLAVARLFRECCPDIPMHASTQLSIHNAEGVKQAKKLGFSRVVLARELSFKEIKSIISEEKEMQIEVFVHGALCMSVSGACYLSSIIGERSGNRGLCAQPCRLDFNANGRSYALSLKDMSYIEHIRELADVGVASLKIEGRMKRPEYVAAAVNACRSALDGKKVDLNVLKDVFSRGGFTDGYYCAKRDISMFGHRTKQDVQASTSVLKSLTQLYKDERANIAVDMQLTVGENFSELRCSAGECEVKVKGAVPRLSSEHALKKESVISSLKKTGGTQFYTGNISLSLAKGYMMSLSEINAMRRGALSALSDELLKQRPNSFFPFVIDEKPQRERKGSYELRARFESFSQLCEQNRFSKIIIPINEIAKHPEVINQLNDKLIGEIPYLIFPEYSQAIKSQLEALKKQGLKMVLCDNIGAVYLARSLDYEIYAGSGLNITNSLSLNEYKTMGAVDICASFELSYNRVKQLKADVPVGIIGYGYLPLMRFRACPLKGESGCESCRGQGNISDRMNTKFSVRCFNKKYSTLYNCVMLYVADRINSEVDFVTLYFTSETKAEVARVSAKFAARESVDSNKTSGLYFRKLK